MIYTLPITKEGIMTLQQGDLEGDDNTWVYGKVYFKEDKFIQFHINDEKEIITVCIPDKDIYLDYDMNTRNLKSIIYTNTCWSDDWTRYDFDENGELYYIEERVYGHNRRAYIDVKDNVVTNVKFTGRTFGTYEEGKMFEYEMDFAHVFQYFNEYFKIEKDYG